MESEVCVSQCEEGLFIQKQWSELLSVSGFSCAICLFNTEYYNDQFAYHQNIEFPDFIKDAVLKRQAEFFAGRYCAKLALTEIGSFPYAIEHGQFREPIWSANMIGSIAHSDQFAVCAVADKQDFSGVGVDIEGVISDCNASRMKHVICNDDELSILPFNDYSQTLLLTLVFSLKESFYKAAFPLVKVFFSFDAVSLKNLSMKQGSATLRLNRDVGILSKGSEFNAHFRHLTDTQLLSYSYIK